MKAFPLPSSNVDRDVADAIHAAILAGAAEFACDLAVRHDLDGRCLVCFRVFVLGLVCVDCTQTYWHELFALRQVAPMCEFGDGFYDD